MSTLTLPIDGMTCASCVARVEKAIGRVPGVQQAQVNLATEAASVDLADDAASAAATLQALQQAVSQAGYNIPQETRRLQIDGMSCASCVGRVEQALRRVPGVVSVSVNLASGVAELQRLAGTAGDAQLAQAAQRAGYQAQPVDDGSSGADGARRQRDAARREGLRVALAALLSAPLVLPMVGDLIGRPGLLPMAPAALQALLAGAVLFGLGRRFFRAGWAALRAGTGNMDLLVATGTSAAYGLSLYGWWQAPPAAADHAAAGHAMAMPPLYFESAAVVVTLVLFGKWLESRAKRRTLSALEALRALRPELAHVERAGQWVDLPVAEVQPGDRVLVRPGERVPVDGLIEDGRSHLDESLLTGESLPVARGPGQRVTGGAINAEGALQVRTTAVGGASTLSRIVALVESAQARKPPIQQTVDRVAAVFVPAVGAVALLTLLGWGLLHGDWSQALIHAVSVLVIACPCALGLATPATLMVGTGLAARHGILVRDAQALELMRQVAVVAFDKTGTLTAGEPRLAALRTPDGDAPGATAGSPTGATDGASEAGPDTPAQRQALALAAALQAASEHPLARAVRQAAAERALAPPAAEQVRAVPGRGIEGVVQGRALALGSTAWLAELGADPARAPALAAAAQAWAAQGRSVSWLVARASAGEPAQVLAALAFGDAPKPQAAAAVAALQQAGVRTVLLSGDNRGAAEAVGRSLGIAEVQAEVLPADKARAVQALRQGLAEGQRVAMVGDGVNDAPALAAADVGLAMTHLDGSGTDLAMQSAGLTLLGGDPMRVPLALALSRAISRRIRQNLFWAFAYNVVGIPLAAFGLLSPMVAGGAMALSSVCVVGNALLLGRWRPPAALQAAGAGTPADAPPPQARAAGA